MIFQAGVSEALDAASQHGYEAVLIVIIIVAALGGVTWLFRMSWIREERLAQRVTSLETKIEDKLISLVDKTATAISESGEAITSLKATLVSLQNHNESSGDKLQACMDKFGEACEGRWESYSDRVLEKIDRIAKGEE